MKVGDLVQHNRKGYGFDGTAVIIRVKDMATTSASHSLDEYEEVYSDDLEVHVLHDTGRIRMWGSWELEVIATTP